LESRPVLSLTKGILIKENLKAFHIYILECNDGSYYIGHTDDIEKRIFEHEQGLTGGYTGLVYQLK